MQHTLFPCQIKYMRSDPNIKPIIVNVKINSVFVCFILEIMLLALFVWPSFVDSKINDIHFEQACDWIDRAGHNKHLINTVLEYSVYWLFIQCYGKIVYLLNTAKLRVNAVVKTFTQSSKMICSSVDFAASCILKFFIVMPT